MRNHLPHLTAFFAAGSIFTIRRFVYLPVFWRPKYAGPNP